MKEQLIAFFESHPEACSIEQLYQAIIPTVSKEEFEQEIHQLVDDFVLVKTKKHKYMLAALMGYSAGILHVVNAHFGFVDGDEHTYVRSDYFNQAMNMDEVIVHRTQGTDGRYEGKIVKVVARHTEYILGTLVVVKQAFQLLAYGNKITLPIQFTNPENLELKAGNRYIAKIDEVSSYLQVHLVSVLGHQDDIGIDVLSVLFEYDIQPDFPDEVNQQLNQHNYQISAADLKGRTDLRDQLIMTIDGEDAKDLDDAISLTRKDDLFILGVHIADVSYYVPEDSPLDKEAYLRSTSTYVVDRVVPMLPFTLSNGICSLNPDEDRLTLTCEMTFDAYANCLESKVYPSIIQSKHRLTYTEVNRLLNEEAHSLPEDVADKLLEMSELSAILREKRVGEGMLDFETSEAKFVLDDAGQVLDIYRVEQGPAESMIEDFMVAANETVAAISELRSLPILYRVHEKPTKEKMQAFSHLARTLGYRMKGNLDQVRPKTVQKVLTHFQYETTYPVVSKILLRSMSKARYDTQCLGHFGLALDHYAHFTSPIRRYPDLLVHRTLRKYLFEENYNDFAKDEARRVDEAKQTSFKEKNSTDAEREVQQMKKVQYMKSKIGEIYVGTISGVTRFGFFVELDNTVEGLVHVKSLHGFFEFDEMHMSLVSQDKKIRYQLGQRVKIKVRSIDTLEDSIDFVLVEQERRKGVVHNGQSRRRKSKSKT